MSGTKNAKVVFDETKLKGSSDMAEKAKASMVEVFKDQFSGEGGVELKISFLQCTKGSRWGRMCCGELGMGWVVLELDWSLVEGDKVLKQPAKFKLRDSGAAGISDLCDSDYGENVLLTQLCQEAARKIVREATPVLA